MSQHLCIARTPRGKAAFVVAGFDRRVGEFFLRTYRGEEPTHDAMRHSSSGYHDLGDLAEALKLERLSTPDTLLAELARDEACNAGNRVVRHDFGRIPHVLLADPGSSQREHALFRAKRPFEHPTLRLAAGERVALVVTDDGKRPTPGEFADGQPFVIGDSAVTSDDFELLHLGPCDRPFCDAAFGLEELFAVA